MHEFRESRYCKDPEDLVLMVNGKQVGTCWRDADKWACPSHDRYLIYWSDYTHNLSGFAYTLEEAKDILLALNGIWR